MKIQTVAGNSKLISVSSTKHRRQKKTLIMLISKKSKNLTNNRWIKLLTFWLKLWFKILVTIINKSKRNILITCFTTSTHLNFRIQIWIRSTYAFLHGDNGYFDFSLHPTSSSVFNQNVSINPKIICNSSPTGHYALFIKLVSMELNHIEVIEFIFPQITVNIST